MPSYKLVYFNGRGRAELVRLLFAFAGQEFEDVRLEMQQWPSLKPDYFMGQLPVLEIDGKQFSQSRAQARHLAREFGFYGSNNLEAFRIDEIIEILGDFHIQAMKVRRAGEAEKDEALKEFKEKQLPKFLSALEIRLKESGTGFFVGSSPSLADLAVYDGLYNLETHFQCSAEDYEGLQSLKDRIANFDKIKEYIAKRPETQF